MLDSKAVFASRLEAIEIERPFQVSLRRGGIDTLAKFAYGPKCTPGSTDEGPFDSWLVTVLGVADTSAINPGQFAALRRLWHESHAVALSDIKSRIERTEDSLPRKLPVPERAARLEEQQRRLQGLRIDDVLEPAYSLVDYVCAMKDDDTLRYVDPAKCCSRTQELGGIKKEQFIKPTADGKVMMVNRDPDLAADLSSELKIRQALTRRSLALDQASLMSFKIGEDYHDYLFSLISMEVPTSHQKVTLEQLLTADAEVYAVMAQQCRSGITMNALGEKPMEKALEVARAHPVVLAMLQPLPKGSQTSPKREANARGASPYQKEKGGGKGKGKGKAKGKGRGASSGPNRPWPDEFKDCHHQTKKGHNICPDFQTERGCGFAQPGQYCKAGLHVCCKCLHAHSASKCSVLKIR